MRRRLAPSLVAVAFVVSLLVPATGLAANGWRFSRTPGTIGNGVAATISITFSNQGGPTGADDLGCVTIAIPSAFTVGSVTVTDEPAGSDWLTSKSGSTTVTIQASNGGDRLDPDKGNQTVTAEIVVSGTAAGHYDWVADAWRSQDCDQGFDDPITVQATIKAKVTATPTPAPTPTPTATPAPTPTPTPAPTPTPTSAPTPTPTSAPTPTSGASATPAPTATAPPTATASPPGQTPGPSVPASTSPTGTPGPATGPSVAGGAGSGPLSSPPGAALVMAGEEPGDGGSGDAPAIDLTGAVFAPFGETFDWAVPGLVLSVPGLLLVLVVLLQMAGALAWLPVVRRRMGAFGLRSRRRSRPNAI